MKRDETIKWLESLKAEIGKSEHRALWHYAEAIDMAIEALQADAVQGYWIYHFDDLFPYESTQECSICHKHQPMNINDENFCPNCGAIMKGGVE